MELWIVFGGVLAIGCTVYVGLLIILAVCGWRIGCALRDRKRPS